MFGRKKKNQTQSQVNIQGAECTPAFHSDLKSEWVGGSVMGNVVSGNVQGNITSVVNNSDGNQTQIQQQYTEEK